MLKIVTLYNFSYDKGYKNLMEFVELISGLEISGVYARTVERFVQDLYACLEEMDKENGQNSGNNSQQ